MTQRRRVYVGVIVAALIIATAALGVWWGQRESPKWSSLMACPDEVISCVEIRPDPPTHTGRIDSYVLPDGTPVIPTLTASP